MTFQFLDAPAAEDEMIFTNGLINKLTNQNQILISKIYKKKLLGLGIYGFGDLGFKGFSDLGI